MTEAQLLEALDIQEYGTFSGMRGIHLPNAVFCGQPASIAFYFTQNDSFSQWGLSSVRVQLRDEPAANEVFRALHESLAGSAVQTETAAYAEWWSDSSLAPGSGSEDESDAVSLIQWFGSGDPELEHTVWFFSSLIQRIEPVLDPTVQPVLDGYALSMQEALTEYAGKNPRLLTQEEIDRVNEAYAHTVYDAETDSLSVLPAASFFTSCYDDVRKLDFGEFLRYFPISGEATEEEFQLLREKYGAEFAFAECETLLDMPVPVHRYETGHIDTAFRRYAGLPFQEFQNRGDVYYLEETGCFYNFTSDFGPGMFPCVDGFVYDGGAILYSESRALYLTEQNGRYYIQAHLPLDIG